MQSEVLFKRGVEVGLTTLRGEGDVVLEAETGAIHFKHGERGQKPRNIVSHQKLQKARKHSPLRIPKELALPTPYPSETDFRHVTSTAKRE